MAQNDRLASVFSIIGCVCSLLVFLSSALTFKKIRREKSVGSHGSFMYVVIFTSTVLWTYYGSLEVNWALIVINAIGGILESVYIAMYIRYATRDSKIRTFTMLAVSVVALVVIIPSSYFLTHFGYRLQVVDKICTVSSLVVFISPLWDMVRVVKTRNAELMSFWLSLALTVSGAAWSVYGLAAHEYSVVVSFERFWIVTGLSPDRSILRDPPSAD
ncbi:hypothetical protein CASFOL_017555 [Castilleja foliolosa]|uniref:Bidirectional sugar transporter SWEET n=1 Tax=Castilleja foliolosa TaxID=1961234 RepID=A0ABD3DAI8_9LAMI